MADGTSIDADIVVISAGVVPNAKLAVEAGIEGDRFIMVDDKMQTSEPDVYACGDVAAYNGVSVGIWSQAETMARVAGANATGDVATYTPVIPSNSFTGFGTSLFSIGDVGHSTDGHYKEIEISEDSKKYYKKLFFLNGKFCGGILMGDTSKSAELIKAYEKKASNKDSIVINLLSE